MDKMLVLKTKRNSEIGPRDRRDETGNAHQSYEDICQENEEPDGDRDDANLCSMNLAGHAQGVAYLVTHRRF